jgi:putative transposase
MVMSFIDSHRKELGIEPICRELAVAPSSYHEHGARLADPAKRSARARRDDEIKQQISQVHAASSGLYGTRKVWHQMRREGSKVVKCTVKRLMRAMGLAGVRRGKTCVTTVSNPKAACPLDKVNRKFRVSQSAQRAVGGRFHLRCASSRMVRGAYDWNAKEKGGIVRMPCPLL